MFSIQWPSKCYPGMTSSESKSTSTFSKTLGVNIVWEAICNVQHRKELQMNSTRAITIKRISNELMLHLQTHPEAQQSFVVFSTKLHQQMCSLVEQKEPMTMAKQKERMWIQYAYHRATTFPEMWRNFLQQIDCQAFLEEPMLLELINETLIEKYHSEKICTYHSIGCKSVNIIQR